jgi:hypothetical protein
VSGTSTEAFVPLNGERYPLVGGTRSRRFDRTNFKPHKPSENAATPTSRVHAVLGGDNGYYTLSVETTPLIPKGILQFLDHAHWQSL